MTTSEETFFAAPRPRPDATLVYGDDADQVIDMFHSPVPTAGLVVLVHGGFWRPAYDRRHLRRTARGVASTGWTVASVEYRRLPGDPDASVDDVVAAAQVARRDFPSGSLVVAGHSAGGHLALLCAARLDHQVSGAVAIGAVTDLAAAERVDLGDGAVQAFLGCAAAERPDLDPMRLPLPTGFVRIIHGTDDRIVPPELTRDYAQRDPRIERAELSGIDHFGPVDPDSSAWSVTIDAISRPAQPA